MKNNLIVLICTLLLLCTSSIAQTWYYSGGRKIQLQKEPLTIYVNYRFDESSNRFLTRIAGNKEVKLAKQSLHKQVLELSLTSQLTVGSMLAKLKKDSAVVHAWEAYSLNGTPYIPTGEVLLKIKQGYTLSDITKKLQLSSKVQAEKVETYDITVIKVTDPSLLFSIANSIYESRMVEWCHPNFYVPVTLYTNDPLYNLQYNLLNTGQLGGVAGIDINIQPAWNVARGQNIRVAVIDDGVEDHEDMAGRVVSGYTPRATSGNGAPALGSAHGEATAGIIGATQDNNIGTSGIAPQCTIVPINIFWGGETTLDLANAINWAWNQGQADVLSNSWAFNTSSQSEAGFDAIIQAITNARTQGRSGKGSAVVFAAGNSWPAINNVSFPGNVNGVITVGACNNAAPSGAIWYYSQQGASMDLVAPSGDINLNGDFTTLDRMSFLGYEGGNYTSRFGGTSAACPQVSGVAALMIAANPAITETQITNFLQTTATDMGAAGFDNTFGFGRLNGCAAVRQALSTATITGAGSFCTSSQYSIGNVNPAIITWSSSNAAIATVSSGNPVTVTKVGNGTITLSASINTGCGTVVLQNQLLVGAPLAPVIRPYNYDHSCGSFMEAYCSEPAGATAYKWNYNFGQVVQEQSYAYIYVAPMRNGIQSGLTFFNYLTVQAKNACGYSSSSAQVSLPFGPVPTTCGGGGGPILLKVSPNPTAGQLVVETTDKTTFTQIKIVDKMGRINKIYKYAPTSRATLQVGDLPMDTYRIQVLIKNEWKTIPFLKQ